MLCNKIWSKFFFSFDNFETISATNRFFLLLSSSETSVERDPIVFYLESIQPGLILNLMMSDGSRDPEDLQLIEEILNRIKTRMIPVAQDSELVQVNGKFVDFALKLIVISAYDYLFSEATIEDQRKKLFEHFGLETQLQTSRRRRTREVETSDW